jgi:hypothetical protein
MIISNKLLHPRTPAFYLASSRRWRQERRPACRGAESRQVSTSRQGLPSTASSIRRQEADEQDLSSTGSTPAMTHCLVGLWSIELEMLCATCSMICHIGKFKFFFVSGMQEWRAASAIGQV